MAQGESRSFSGDRGSRGLIQKGTHQDASRQLLLSVLVLPALLLVNAKPDGHAHSFQHFHGPVMGDEHGVTWRDGHGHHEDYVGHPHYAFSYGVEDRHTGDYHGQKEHGDGTEVFGEYTVKEPDGNIRTVKYRAGKDGFHAQVHNSHESDHHHNAPQHHHHHHQPHEYR
ncbi:PREDICTED: histidine-rich glycoprotein-like [Dinoponera quadriceps]|uniref:Histidine-rich glycoprotein-like n=1 Tax=Dinoponera quadriceps TaxID=609295 RepID=A0A6P3WNY2_DINQU|nr:PREDICTED: histidine-rich glycoprotein-like [Dinoponera quadriceps]